MNDQIREKETDIDTVLPPVAELVKGKPTYHRFIDLDGQEQVLDYRDVAQQDPYPIPLPIDREGYGTIEHSPQHWATGHGDWLNVCNALARYHSSKTERLFDFGCATGRFLRHVMLFSDLQAHGCDFAPANVDWVKRHLPGDMNVVLNTADPELPFPERHFDIVTAFSVFTHIDEGEKEWLEELKRVTKKSGLLYITIQNEASWKKVLGRPGMFAHLENAKFTVPSLTINEELFERPMPSDRIVFRKSEDHVYNSNVWHSTEYIHQHWSPHLEILDIANNAHTSFQSSVIARPK